MGKIQVGIEQAAEGERYLTVTCPDCERTNRYPFETLEPGVTLECGCGVGFNFSQANYDDLREKYGFAEPDSGTN